MVCGNCKYFKDGLCEKHGTLQTWDCRTSCGEYEMWDDNKQEWIKGTLFYELNN